MGKTTNYRILYFQIKTFLINVVGCLFIGLITVAAGRNTAIDEKWILFLKVGFCGGFTTFSTFALETTEPMKKWTFRYCFSLCVFEYSSRMFSHY